ncbi:hypothetical protein [Pseudoxanthomonas japonensis]|nr:hypothetical protein [Pseudoxanthomonas japonensis]
MNMDVDEFEKVSGQLDGVYQEISVLVKKSPNDAVNSFKIGLINSTIRRANDLLEDKYRPFQEFSEFSSDDLPTNSDVALIVSQYIECMEKLRADNIYQEMGNWYWRVEGRSIRTLAPRKLRRK